MADPAKPRPYYQLFFGTSAYAASEILRKQPYQAAPAEIWTLGILLSYLLTGATPFVSEWEAMQGRIMLREGTALGLSANAVSLMRRCLDPDPKTRADINEVRQHVWLEGEPCCGEA
jgi:serine/threonine protein kinase